MTSWSWPGEKEELKEDWEAYRLNLGNQLQWNIQHSWEQHNRLYELVTQKFIIGGQKSYIELIFNSKTVTVPSESELFMFLIQRVMSQIK